MGDVEEPQPDKESTSDPKDLDSLNHESNSKGSPPMPLLRVAVDDEGDDDSAHHHRPANSVSAPHLRVAMHDDGDEDSSGEEREESEEEENGDEHEEGEEDNPMEEPAVEEADTLSKVRIVAHVTDGTADSDTGEQLAFPDEQYDEESDDEHEGEYEDDHDEEETGDAQESGDTLEGNHSETLGEARKEDNPEENIVDDDEEDKETRAVIHVQGYDKGVELHAEPPSLEAEAGHLGHHVDDPSHEMGIPEHEMDDPVREIDEQEQKVLVDEMNHLEHEEQEQERETNHLELEIDHQEHEMSPPDDDHTQARSDDQEMNHAKVDELRALINLAEEEEFEGDKMGDDMNGVLVEEDVKEQPGVPANGELPALHDHFDELRYSVVDQADAGSSKQAKVIAPVKVPIEKIATEKKKYASAATLQAKPGRPSSAIAARSDGPARVKRDAAAEEGESSDSTSRSKGSARPSVRGSRAKVTVPQPFHLATEKRASMIGRPTDPVDAPKLRHTLVRKSQPVLRTPRPVSAVIRAAPTEISKEDQAEKDRQAKLEEEIAALRIKVENPSGFSFKSDERAEKRREFYSKLEEKMKAKEEEKSQHQAKSQEELENRMRLLRKTLTFKATPLPSFYQESAPPKAEVRKIPPTRPKSPKLTTSRRSTLTGDRDGSRSPVARIRSELRGSALYKSVDSATAYALKSSVRKPLPKIPPSTASGRPKVTNGTLETPRKAGAVPASVIPSPRNKPRVVAADKTPVQEKKTGTSITPRGRSTDPRKPVHNGERPATTNRPKTAEIKNGKPKAEGVRKSLQWTGPSARRENVAAQEAVKLGGVSATSTTTTKRPLTPNV